MFAVLVLLAAVLRFWGFPDIPYTHDEISALVRVDFPTLSEAIHEGIWNIDTHPPGTHVFLWCWTRLFGSGDGAVKAPFILMSIAGVFFLYRSAYAWAGGGVALITTALFASAQYMVMYGQIARPYAMGFFTTALMADQLTRYAAHGNRKSLLLFGLAGVISAYTHHFALMQAAFMYTTGCFLVPSSYRKAYLLTGLAMVLCYVPNMPLFLSQLGWKGLDSWLTPPGADWIPSYLWWFAHCSWVLAMVLIALLIASLALRLRSGTHRRPLLVMTLVWGMLPLIVGYAYSVWRSPVLQYSVLIFSFPYLLIGLFAGLRDLAPRMAMFTALITAAVATITLITSRAHYAVFLHSKYEAIVRGTAEAERNGAEAVVDLPPEVLRFYRKLWCFTPSQAPCVDLADRPSAVLDSVLRTTTKSTLFYGQTSHAAPENVARITTRFPFLLERHDFVEGQTFLFSVRPGPEHIDDIERAIIAAPEAIGGRGWRVDKDLPLVRDTTHSYMPATWDFSGREFGIVLDSGLTNLVSNENDIVEVIADFVNADTACDLTLVVELRSGDSTIFYRADRRTDHAMFGSSGRLVVALKCADLAARSADPHLRTYLWNPAKARVHIASVRMQVREGDPVLYGFFRPVPARWRFPWNNEGPGAMPGPSKNR